MATNCPIPDLVTIHELDRPVLHHWLWHGYVAAGAITLLTGRWKSGKTTLVSILLAKMAAGGELAGQTVVAGRVAVVSEESPQLWVQRGQQLAFPASVGFLFRPYRNIPDQEQWGTLINRLLATRVDLVVIDSLAAFFPRGADSQPALLQAAFDDLRALTRAGTGVLVLHHPSKKSSPDDPRPRGCNALPDLVDISILFDHPRRAEPRRRRLRASSVWVETPKECRIELNEAGTDYTIDTEKDLTERGNGWPLVHELLTAAGRPLTRQEIIAAWPSELAAPCRMTLWRWLTRGVRSGVIEEVRGGEGGRVRYRRSTS